MVDLVTLPPPPAGKAGWPWTEETPPAPERMPDGQPWPRVSIVTPSYNQGRFLEETIRSVLLQGYPNLEYIVVDGGSTDESVAIIRKYERWLNGWVSEKDRGQSHAINKGFARATGEVFGWLNSDDYYLPGALHALMRFRAQRPEAPAWAGGWREVDMEGRAVPTPPSPLWCARWRDVDIDGRVIRQGLPRLGPKDDLAWWGRNAAIMQPSCLFSAPLFRELGGLKEDLHFAMDLDLWLGLSARGLIAGLDEAVSAARYYMGAKSLQEPAMCDAEVIAICFAHGCPEQAKQRLLDYANYCVEGQVQRYRQRLGEHREWLALLTGQKRALEGEKAVLQGEKAALEVEKRVLQSERKMLQDTLNHILNKPIVRFYRAAKQWLHSALPARRQGGDA